MTTNEQDAKCPRCKFRGMLTSEGGCENMKVIHKKNIEKILATPTSNELQGRISKKIEPRGFSRYWKGIPRTMT